MGTSAKELKQRLRNFLAAPQADGEFRKWFAAILIDIDEENDAEAEQLAQAIHLAFAEAADGEHKPSELRRILMSLSEPPTMHLATGGILFSVVSSSSSTLESRSAAFFGGTRAMARA